MIPLLAVMTFGLAVLVTCEIVARYLSAVREFWAFAMIGVGIVFAWVGHANVFAAWDFALRNDWMGVTLTGFALGGVAYFWHEVLGLFGGLARKYSDEAETIEKSQGLRRVA